MDVSSRWVLAYDSFSGLGSEEKRQESESESERDHRDLTSTNTLHRSYVRETRFVLLAIDLCARVRHSQLLRELFTGYR